VLRLAQCLHARIVRRKDPVPKTIPNTPPIAAPSTNNSATTPRLPPRLSVHDVLPATHSTSSFSGAGTIQTPIPPDAARAVAPSLLRPDTPTLFPPPTHRAQATSRGAAAVHQPHSLLRFFQLVPWLESPPSPARNHGPLRNWFAHWQQRPSCLRQIFHRSTALAHTSGAARLAHIRAKPMAPSLPLHRRRHAFQSSGSAGIRCSSFQLVRHSGSLSSAHVPVGTAFLISAASTVAAHSPQSFVSPEQPPSRCWH